MTDPQVQRALDTLVDQQRTMIQLLEKLVHPPIHVEFRERNRP